MRITDTIATPVQGKNIKKSDILERWYKVGFTHGLKAGSVIEWRCAKSFNDMAIYLLEETPNIGNDKTMDYVTSLAFPIIRRLVTGKGRICTILDPKQVLEEIFNVKTADIFELLWGRIDELNNKKGYKPKLQRKMYGSIMEFFNTFNSSKEEPFIEFMYKMFEDPENDAKTHYFCLGAGIDLEAECVRFLYEIMSENMKNKVAKKN